MNIVPSSNCIICLEESPINNSKYGVLPLPCYCKAFIHKKCFQQLNSHNCLICKQPNHYSNSNLSLQKISRKFKEIKITVNNNPIEVYVERDPRISYCEIVISNIMLLIKYLYKMRKKVIHNIKLFCRKTINLRLNICKIISDFLSVILIIIFESIILSIGLFIIYFTGFLVILMITLVFGIEYKLYSDIGLILLNMIIGCCCCSCCFVEKARRERENF
jgi:hypothetical protein